MHTHDSATQNWTSEYTTVSTAACLDGTSVSLTSARVTTRVSAETGASGTRTPPPDHGETRPCDRFLLPGNRCPHVLMNRDATRMPS